MKKYRLYFALALISIFCMLIVTTTSPLYYVNNADDGNIMFTVGKSVLHGLMPYKDLFDQRGPIIYFINTLAALISYKNFFGIFIFEVIATFIDFLFIYKTLNLRYSCKFSFISVICLIPFLFNSKLFIYGNTPEEFILPLIMITIYLLTKESPERWSNKKYILMGIFMGLSFWIKFTLSTTWVALILSVMLFFLFKGNYRETFLVFVNGALGYLVVSLPIIIIFALKNALYDLFYVYFYLNATKYYGERPSMIFQLILLTGIIIGSIVYIRTYRKSFRINNLQTYILAFILTFNVFILFYSMKQSLFYYFFILEFTFIVIPIVFYNVFRNSRILKKFYIVIPLFAVAFIFAANKNYLHSSFLKSENQSVDLYQKKKVPYQLEFSTIINRSKDKSFLNYNSMDVGIYTYSGLIPTVKYFMVNNLPYSVMYRSQDRYLKSLKFKYIVTRHDFLNKPRNKYYVKNSIYKVLKKHYRLVDKRDVLFQKNKTEYMLFEKNN